MRQRLTRWVRSRWGTFLFAAVITALSVLLCSTTDLAHFLPFGLVLLFAVALSAYLGGLWPGLLSTLLGAVSAPYLFDRIAVAIGGVHYFTAGRIWFFIAVFVFMGAIVSALFEALHRSRRASDAARRELSAILAYTGDAVINTDAAGRIQYLNRAAAALLHSEFSAVVGKPFESVVKIRDTNDATLASSLIQQVRSVGHTLHLASQQFLMRADGTQLAVEATAAPVRTPEGELVSVVVTIRDCTEQRQIESVLRERLALQARFERIAAVVPGAIYEFRVRADGREQLLYASHAFKEIHGVDAALFLEDASSLRTLMVLDDAARVSAIMTAATEAQTLLNVEYRILTPHRGLRWVATLAAPVPEANGDMLWHGIFMDVTERKRAEEQSHARQLQLREALDASAMGTMTINLDSGAIELDTMARRLLGMDSLPDAPVTIEHLVSVLDPEYRQTAKFDYEQIKQAGARALNLEYRMSLANGQERWVACRGRIYVDNATGALMGAGVIMDVTQHRRVEEQRLHSQKLEALGVLAAGIAHDFNNLLLAISGNAKLLLTDLPQLDPARTSVCEIDKAALRAAELVRRILNFSSVQELGRPGPPLMLQPVLDEILELAHRVLPATTTINFNIPKLLPEVIAEGSQVHQTIINLLTNAGEATAAVGGGTITLEAAAVDVDDVQRQVTPEVPPGRYVCISVTDAGRGIDASVLPRIFDPFFSTKTAGSGTGLGLAIVHGIMKNVGGAVTVRSEPGHGATFSLYFPAYYGAAIAAQPVTSPASITRPVHILYVDDEESLIFLMTRTLERMGHRVTACSSPEVALEKFMADPDAFDLVVSDMAMPGLSGLELAEQVLKVRPQLPFIITSGFVDADDVERARAVGVRQMIIKPNTVDELCSSLSVILREQQGSAAAQATSLA